MGASVMVRATAMISPFLLGFDDFGRPTEKAAKGGADGYPPYNVERLAADESHPERLRITLAVAGFARNAIEILHEGNELVVKGKQADEAPRDYLHRGIAARQFRRAFGLADGAEVLGAELAHGLLSIDVARPEPNPTVRKIDIISRG